MIVDLGKDQNLGLTAHTWDLSNNLHDRIFGTKISHTNSVWIATVFTKKKPKKNSVNALISLFIFWLEFKWVCKILTI